MTGHLISHIPSPWHSQCVNKSGDAAMKGCSFITWSPVSVCVNLVWVLSFFIKEWNLRFASGSIDKPCFIALVGRTSLYPNSVVISGFKSALGFFTMVLHLVYTRLLLLAVQRPRRCSLHSVQFACSAVCSANEAHCSLLRAICSKSISGEASLPSFFVKFLANCRGEEGTGTVFLSCIWIGTGAVMSYSLRNEASRQCFLSSVARSARIAEPFCTFRSCFGVSGENSVANFLTDVAWFVNAVENNRHI